MRGTQPGLRRSPRFETDYVCRRQTLFRRRVTHRGRNEAETRAEGRARAAQKFGKHGREATSPDVFGHRPGFAELPRRGVRARVLRPWLFFPRTRPTTAASAAQTIKPELARLADVETIKPFHEFSTNDQTVWDLRSGKGAAAVVFFPAHTADHDGHSSADNQARTCKVVGQGTMIPFHEFSELHQTVSHAQYKGLPANVLTAEKWICARDTCSADRRFATKSRATDRPQKQDTKQKATSGPQNRRRRWAQNIIQRIFGRWRDGDREVFLLLIYATLCCY